MYPVPLNLILPLGLEHTRPSDVVASCVTAGAAFGLAEAAAVWVWMRRGRLSICRRTILQRAGIGFAIGGVGMTAGAWLRSKTFEFLCKGTPKSLLHHPRGRKDTESAENGEKSNKNQDNDFLFMVGYGILVYAVWTGGLYPLLLGMTLSKEKGIRLAPYVLRGMASAIPGLLLSTYAAFGLFTGISALRPELLEPLSQIIITVLVTCLAIRTGLKLRKYLNPNYVTVARSPIMKTGSGTQS